MLTEEDMHSILSKKNRGKKLDAKEVTDLIYNSSWSVIQKVVSERCGIGYKGMDDFHLVMNQLPLKDLEEAGVEYNIIELLPGEDGLGVKTRLQEEFIAPLLKYTIHAVWRWEDVDIVSETHPHAKNGQLKSIKKLHDMFVEQVTSAKINNDAVLRAFIADVDAATKENVEKLYKMGFELKQYSIDKDVKLHYFNTFKRTIDDDATRSFRANLNDVLQQFDQKADVAIEQIAAVSGLKAERIETLWKGENSRPKLGQIVQLQSALSKIYQSVVLLNKPLLGEYVVQIQREYDTDEQNDIGIIRGHHQLKYKTFSARKTNFLPFVREVREKYTALWNDSKPPLTDAWLEKWGPKPTYENKHST